MLKVSKPPTYRLAWPVYAKEWDGMQIKASARDELHGFVARAMAGKDRYLDLQRTVAAAHNNDGVPWWLSAILAERESGQNWSRSLAQGDRWNRVSVNEPRGRGPFQSWKAAALDALHLDHLDIVIDWRLEKALYACEGYNGWGYYFHGVPSCYVWGATTVQKPGKYTSDGVFNSRVWDTQLGCAAMLHALMDTDPTVKPIRES